MFFAHCSGRDRASQSAPEKNKRRRTLSKRTVACEIRSTAPRGHFQPGRGYNGRRNTTGYGCRPSVISLRQLTTSKQNVDGVFFFFSVCIFRLITRPRSPAENGPRDSRAYFAFFGYAAARRTANGRFAPRGLLGRASVEWRVRRRPFTVSSVRARRPVASSPRPFRLPFRRRSGKNIFSSCRVRDSPRCRRFRRDFVPPAFFIGVFCFFYPVRRRAGPCGEIDLAALTPPAE